MDVAIRLQLDTVIWAIGTVIFIIVTSLMVGHLARLFARWRGWSGTEQQRMFWGFAFAGPWIVGFLIFVVGPALASLYYSFTDYRLGEEIGWVGIENYRELILGDGSLGRRFHSSMWNSFYYALIGVPLQVLTALGMALLLNQSLRGVKLFRLIFYLPVILAGGPALLLAWRYMLNANGGFINETLQGIAHSFFLFDYLYRGFIFAVEGFNGFYAGLAKGDPIGPLAFAFPALIGVLTFIPLVWGDWSESKRALANQIAEIVGCIVGGLLLARGLVTQPIDPVWSYIAAAALLLLILRSSTSENKTVLRILQFGGLLIFGASLISTLTQPQTDMTSAYIIPLVVSMVAIVISLFGASNPRRLLIIGGAAALVLLIAFVSVSPTELGAGRVSLIPRYLTLSSGITQVDNPDYLEQGYGTEWLSPAWIYGLLVVALIVISQLQRYPRTRRYVLYGTLAFFALFLVSSLIDSVRFFNAFGDIATSAGRPNFHFALFHNSVNEFPDSNRVPLWARNELWSKPSLILITMWSSGAGMLIFLAALKSVPSSLYESAQVDGASKIQQFFSITIPIITPAIFYNVVIGMIAALQTFESIYILQNGDIEDSLTSAAYFLFQRTFQQLAIGEGSAMSWILVVVIVGLTALQFRYSNWVHYESEG